MKYQISQHAKQRYAERLRNRNEIIEINSFIQKNEEKIKTDINTMIEHGELIFEGKQDYSSNNNKVQVYLKDTWVLILDPAKSLVVTLYSIDLGLGNEFNRDYISKMKDKIKEEKEKVQKAREDINGLKKSYEAVIEENDTIISQYSVIIKSLKEQNEDYKKLIKDLDVNKMVAETKVRELLGKLIGKKSF